jgi:NAD(P)-dependent dehydrogenase (short-subunit alcohol dehydrogenase family)
LRSPVASFAIAILYHFVSRFALRAEGDTIQGVQAIKVRPMATVFITGGNRGIGLALVERYLARGDMVFATYRTAGTQPQLGRTGSGGRPLPAGHALTALQADVTDETSLAAAHRALGGRPVDILICNAGMNDGRGGLDAISNTFEMWQRLMATNVSGVFFTAKTFAPSVIAARGKIAVISSRMGSSAAAAGSSYAYRASKAAASNIAANLAVELKPHGVAVASYHPGWVKTDMGGAGADIDVTTSVQGLVARIDALSMTSTGAFETFDGTPLVY